MTNSRHQQAVRYDCPDCGVRAGRYCVYMWPTTYRHIDLRHDKTFPAIISNRMLALMHGKSPAVRRQMVMAGTPTTKTHNGRLRALWADEMRWKSERERRRLREWLLAYGDIFEVGQSTPS